MFIRFPDGTLLNADKIEKIDVTPYENHVCVSFRLPNYQGQSITIDTKANAEKLLNKIWELIAQGANCIDLSTIIPSTVQNNVYLLEEEQKRGI